MKIFDKLVFTLLIASFSVLNAQIETSPQEKFAKSKDSYIAPCQELYGSALVDCMDALDNERFLIQLYLLNSEKYQRKGFFEKKLTNPEEYEKFYKRFKTDEEWQVIADQFTPEERAFFPNIYTKQQQEEDVSSRKLWRNGKKYGLYTAGAVVLIGTGGYGAVWLYNYAYAAGAAAKAAELAAVIKATAAGVTAEKAAAGGTAVVVGALCGGAPESKQKDLPK